jgi:hypothetical protein
MNCKEWTTLGGFSEGVRRSFVVVDGGVRRGEEVEGRGWRMGVGSGNNNYSKQQQQQQRQHQNTNRGGGGGGGEEGGDVVLFNNLAYDTNVDLSNVNRDACCFLTVDYKTPQYPKSYLDSRFFLDTPYSLRFDGKGRPTDTPGERNNNKDNNNNDNNNNNNNDNNNDNNNNNNNKINGSDNSNNNNNNRDTNNNISDDANDGGDKKDGPPPPPPRLPPSPLLLSSPLYLHLLTIHLLNCVEDGLVHTRKLFQEGSWASAEKRMTHINRPRLEKGRKKRMGEGRGAGGRGPAVLELDAGRRWVVGGSQLGSGDLIYDSRKHDDAAQGVVGEKEKEKVAEGTLFTSASSLLIKEPENVGLAVLEKMGWRRTGLGRKGDGQMDPVVLPTQTHRMGVGIYTENSYEEEN